MSNKDVSLAKKDLLDLGAMVENDTINASPV